MLAICILIMAPIFIGLATLVVTLSLISRFGRDPAHFPED